MAIGCPAGDVRVDPVHPVSDPARPVQRSLRGIPAQIHPGYRFSAMDAVPAGLSVCRHVGLSARNSQKKKGANVCRMRRILHDPGMARLHTVGLADPACAPFGRTWLPCSGRPARQATAGSRRHTPQAPPSPRGPNGVHPGHTDLCRHTAVVRVFLSAGFLTAESGPRAGGTFPKGKPSDPCGKQGSELTPSTGAATGNVPQSWYRGCCPEFQAARGGAPQQPDTGSAPVHCRPRSGFSRP